MSGASSTRSARALLSVLALVSIMPLSLACVERGTRPPRFTNLVLVVIDTLRADHLASYGYHRATAPFLDRLASEGLQLRGAAASSWTKPSVATLLTGLHPQRHRANTRAEALASSLPFLPEILQRGGFATLGYTANWFTGPAFGFDRGFDEFIEVWPPEPLRQDLFRNPASPDKPHASWATDTALELVRGVGSPFFLSVHYLDPHDPYTPTTTWEGEAASADRFVQPADLDAGAVGAEQLRQLVDQYDAVIRETDAEIERLFEGLGALGLLDRTLWVVTSDHGEEFLDHGKLTHGKTLFEEVLQVPLLLWSADGTIGSGAGQRLHQVDLLPTLLQALGVEVPSGLDGVGRWRELAGGGEIETELSLHHLDLDSVGALAVLSSPWKLIHELRPFAKPGEPNGTSLLFRLDLDPAESRHLDEESEVREELLRGLVARHNELSRRSASADTRILDDSLRRQLGALGYLDDSTPQEDLEKRNLPDRMRFFDARTWGLFGGGEESHLPGRVEYRMGEATRRAPRLPRGVVASSGRPAGLHWVLRGAGSRLALDGEVAHGAGPLSCTLEAAGSSRRLDRLDGPFDIGLALAEPAVADRPVYIDLRCEAAGGDDSGAFARLAVGIE